MTKVFNNVFVRVMPISKIINAQNAQQIQQQIMTSQVVYVNHLLFITKSHGSVNVLKTHIFIRVTVYNVLIMQLLLQMVVNALIQMKYLMKHRDRVYVNQVNLVMLMASVLVVPAEKQAMSKDVIVQKARSVEMLIF